MTASDIIREVAASHGLTVAQVRGKSLAPKMVAIRVEIAARLQTERRLSYRQIGRMLGRTWWAIRYHLRPGYRARRLGHIPGRTTTSTSSHSGVGRTCSIPDCGKPHYARGWCPAHYHRWRNYGDPRGAAKDLHAFRSTQGDDTWRPHA
jgi:hypothetical protein